VSDNEVRPEAPPPPPAPAKPGEAGSWIDRIIRFCLENRLVVALAVLATTFAGIVFAPFDWDLGGLPRHPVATDAIPDIGENQQIVFTEWEGRSPKDVEDQITYPLTSALLGVPRVKVVRGYSNFGFSMVYLIFDEGADFYWTRGRVVEKLASLRPDLLPPGVRPTLGPDATALGQIFWYALEGRDPDGRPVGGWDLQELRSIQDWTVRLALLGARGVSDVGSIGGFEKEYQIDVDPDAMRAFGVGLDEIARAVQQSNIDVGARTIEINRVAYLVRGRGFLRGPADIEQAVIKAVDGVPVCVKDVARVSPGPAIREGALDKEGAEAVGAVVAVRHGFNPLEAIKNVKAKVAEIAPGLPTRAVVDWKRVGRDEVEAFARAHGFAAFDGADLRHADWVRHLRATPRAEWPPWITTSQVQVVPFYDRTDLILETLGTLNAAILEEVLVTVLVILVMVVHFRSSLLIGGLLPLAVLMCFTAMKVFGVDANIVALSGIAIAIGTMVDMGIIICENILNHLREAPPEESRLEVVYRAASEVGSAVLTAVSTTVVSFLPIFTMTGSEGKLFGPLAYTKTFALIASALVAVLVIPVGAHWLFTARSRSRFFTHLASLVLAVVGVGLGWRLGWWRLGGVLVAIGAYVSVLPYLPKRLRQASPWVATAAAVVLVGYVLTAHWEPLGPERGLVRNLVFVTVLVGGMLAFFALFQRFYATVLRWCLAHKWLFLCLPALVLAAGLYIWIGPGGVAAALGWVGARTWAAALYLAVPAAVVGAGLWVWRKAGLSPAGALAFFLVLPGVLVAPAVLAWTGLLPTEVPASVHGFKAAAWGDLEDRGPWTYVRWAVANDWEGRGQEFMPPLDEGSFLFMPVLMPHASIGQALEVLAMQDRAIRAISEVDGVVGKIGRAETPLDPAPLSMVETVITYKPEYAADTGGRRLAFAYDEARGEFVRDAAGRLVPDPAGRPFRQWRDQVRSADDIWREIVRVTEIPGVTTASKLQPIAARIVMLQSGIRAPMGVKIHGPDLETIERVGLQIEGILRQVPGVEPATVFADRIVAKPYVEIDIDREAIRRYGLSIRDVQDVVEAAIGGQAVTATVEGRERYGVRVRYLRERRDRLETLGRVLVPTPGGAQVPLDQLARIDTGVRGPEMIKSEDTALVGYVLFDKRPRYAEVDVVEACQQELRRRLDAGTLVLPAGTSYAFTGTYESQVRARRTLSLVLPAALFTIFLILYFQFRRSSTTLLVFSTIPVCWAGGFLLIWLYGQPWFLDFSVFGVGMRDLFQVHPINLSVAIWVGFLALFGIASDDGVVMATYLDQSFARREVRTVHDVREAVVAGGTRRIRPCLMTTATTILALLPVLTSSGRGADVMIPMAIPSFGGMCIELMTMFIVPVLYCAVREFRLKRQPR
jgi:Cu(I)/Ag(I) efflux system membrane protein CusA/SilA